MELPAGSLVRVEHADITVTKLVSDPRRLLPSLRPTRSPADGDESGHVSNRQGRTRQKAANPMMNQGPQRQAGGGLRSLNPVPDGFPKVGRKRRVRAPFLQDFAERFVLVSAIVGFHVTQARATDVTAAFAIERLGMLSPRLFQRCDLKLATAFAGLLEASG